jgi:DnaJ-class molecular chaperone
MNSVICPNCKGKKYVYDHVLGVFTFGMGYLMGRNDKCETCKGKGYILLP